MARNTKILLFGGLLLVVVSALFLAFLKGAEWEAKRLGKFQEDSPEAYPADGAMAEVKAPIKVGNVDYIVARTDPPGAVVSPADLLNTNSPRITPTLVRNSRTPMNFETRFRQSQASDIPADRHLKLDLKPLVLFLLNLFWPGLIMLGLALKQVREQEVERDKPLSTSRTYSSVRLPEAEEKNSETRVVEQPEARQLSQAFPIFDTHYEHDPKTPEELIYGRFIKGEIIGKGGMGTVYRCRSCQAGDQRTYALKVLLPEWSKSADFRARFERESDICHKLTHRNLVRAYERGEKDGNLWMVMDFVQGSELNQWLKEQKRSDKEIVELFVQICDGLTHAHSQDIVHRDLKPENILISEDGKKAVIADFGLAKGKHYATITKTNTTLGTPIYMPPEQITGGSGGPLGDLYSLGCILYESLSGKIPFPGNDVLALLNSKLKGEAPPALSQEQANPELRAVVEKLMAFKAEDRFQSAEELKDSLILLSRESTSSGS